MKSSRIPNWFIISRFVVYIGRAYTIRSGDTAVPFSSFFHSLQPRKSASMLVWGWARTPTRIDPRRRVACLSFWILGMCFPSNLPTNTISTSLFRQSMLKEIANASAKFWYPPFSIEFFFVQSRKINIYYEDIWIIIRIFFFVSLQLVQIIDIQFWRCSDTEIICIV